MAVCSLHKTHSPGNRTLELHHIVPVAWQLRTTVLQPPAPGRDHDGRGLLWDARTAAICPTGHRNVHYWIVTLMHAIATQGGEDVQAAWQTLGGHVHRLAEAQTALLALERFHPYGSLLSLTAANEWGES